MPAHRAVEANWNKAKLLLKLPDVLTHSEKETGDSPLSPSCQDPLLLLPTILYEIRGGSGEWNGDFKAEKIAYRAVVYVTFVEWRGLVRGGGSDAARLVDEECHLSAGSPYLHSPYLFSRFPPLYGW